MMKKIQKLLSTILFGLFCVASVSAGTDISTTKEETTKALTRQEKIENAGKIGAQIGAKLGAVVGFVGGAVLTWYVGLQFVKSVSIGKTLFNGVYETVVNLDSSYFKSAGHIVLLKCAAQAILNGDFAGVERALSNEDLHMAGACLMVIMGLMIGAGISSSIISNIFSTFGSGIGTLLATIFASDDQAIIKERLAKLIQQQKQGQLQTA